MKKVSTAGRAGAELAGVTITASLLFLLVVEAVYGGAVSEDSARSSNRLFGITPFFKLIYEQIHLNGLDTLAIIPLLISIPFIGVLSFALWSLARLKGGRTRGGAVEPPARNHPLLVLQFPIILAALLIEYSLGLPLGIGVFGHDIYSTTSISIYGITIIAIIHVSLAITVIGGFTHRDREA